ncbi:MAG: hypothetical protein PWP09_514 [Thermotogota bacterium]|nr:hypothetical protein [Thermotogota bacterium]
MRYFLVILASFFTVFTWGTLIGYDYAVHLTWESIIVFAYVVTFILFLSLPINRKSSTLPFFGLTLLGVAVLEWVHALLYQGFYVDHPGLATEYWIFARSLFTVGIFTMVLTSSRRSDYLKKLKYVPLALAAFLIFSSHFIPETIFHVSGTTVWKSSLEITFAGLLFVSAYLTRRKKPFAWSLILAGFGELSFVYYGENVFTDQFVIGHAFVVSSAVLLAYWASVEHVFIPFTQLEELTKSYGVARDELAEKVIEKERALESLAEVRSKILAAHTLNELKEVLISLIPEQTIVFHRKTPIFKSTEALPDNQELDTEWNKMEVEDFSLYYKHMEEEAEELLRNILPDIHIKLEELETKEELRLSKIELEKAIEYRTNFMRSLSHELKTPLSIIYGHIQLMEIGAYGENSHLKEPLQTIKTAVLHAVELVNSLLNLARTETGRLSIKAELLNFDNLKPIVGEYEQLALQKGLEFSFDFKSEEPFSCDYKMFSAILSNLLSNAVKYTEKGGISGRLEVLKDRIILEVSDTGKGIPKERLENIFEPFEGEKRLTSSGLGLAIVKKFVETLNGTIAVESEEGRGTTFHVEIPRLQRPQSFEAKEHVQILIVDPDPQIRNMLKKILKEHSITEAASGYEAYLKALEHSPELVITSLGLPDVSGEELIRRLKEEPLLSDTKFILFTGARVEKDDQIVIEKGTDIEELAAKLNIILGNAVILAYSEQAKRCLSLAEDLLRRLSKEKITIKELKAITDDDIKYYGSFALLLQAEEIEEIRKIITVIHKKEKAVVTVILIYGGDEKVRWHV